MLKLHQNVVSKAPTTTHKPGKTYPWREIYACRINHFQVVWMSFQNNNFFPPYLKKISTFKVQYYSTYANAFTNHFWHIFRSINSAQDKLIFGMKYTHTCKYEQHTFKYRYFAVWILQNFLWFFNVNQSLEAIQILSESSDEASSNGFLKTTSALSCCCRASHVRSGAILY